MTTAQLAPGSERSLRWVSTVIGPLPNTNTLDDINVNHSHGFNKGSALKWFQMAQKAVLCEIKICIKFWEKWTTEPRSNAFNRSRKPAELSPKSNREEEKYGERW